MEFFADNILLIIFLPLWISLIILSGAAFKLSENRKMTVLLTLLSTFTGLIFSIGVFNYIGIKKVPAIENTVLWLEGENLNIFVGTLIDSTSAIFLVILMLISFLVQLYSYGYMKDKNEFNRYFIYLNFFNFAMTGLILSPNLIQLYIFWELVGIASYLLIGFFHNEKEVSSSAKRVFIINRIGDCALLTGIIIFAYFSITYINQMPNNFLAFSDIENFHNQLLSLTYPNVYNIMISLFLIGAFVKSAQFPFQIWLVDAMKAPTPVSALIHSATMVCMGIYLIIRIYPLLNQELLNIILTIGLISTLLCAFIAISQTNIKKMLAYSTSSQLGLMFCALGLSSVPVTIIYLVIHSFTKALLFLCSGIVEKTFNTLDMTQMGALRKINLYLALYWIICALSLSGLFFGGFTSKEILVDLISNSKNNSILFIVLLSSFMTAYYIFKAYFIIFEGSNEQNKRYSDRSMTIAVTIMSIFVIFPGFIFKMKNLNFLCSIIILIGLCAAASAYYSSKCNKITMPVLLYKLSYNELFLPHLYNLTAKLFLYLYSVINLFEKYIIEVSLNIIVEFNKFLSNVISKMQNGNIQTYIAYSIFSTGIILMIILYFYQTALRG